MNISLLTGVSAITQTKTKKTTLKPQGLKNDAFVKTQATSVDKSSSQTKIDIESIKKELQTFESFNGKPKFKEDKIEELTKIIQETPEKWEAIRTISKEPKMISSLVMDFASRDVETLTSIADLATRKNENGEAKFSPLDIRNLANKLNAEELGKVGILAGAPLDGDEVIAIVKDKNLQNLEKLVKKVNQFVKDTPDLRRLSFQKDEFDENGYTIKADLADNGAKTLLVDSNMNERALEIVSMEKSPEGHMQQVKKTNDYRNHTTSKVISMTSPSIPTPIVIDEIKIVKNAQGQTLRKEMYSLSDLAGTPNIKHIYPDGTEKIISSGKFDENTGKTTVQKDMTSLDGTRTQYYYEDTPDGNVSSSYKITDKNGNVLLDKQMTFTVIDKNTFISTENDKKYEIKFTEGKINITNMNNGEKSVLNIEEMTDGNKEKLMQSLRHMPAEELIALGKTTEKLTGIDNTYQSTYAATTKTIKSGDNLFTILHEAGHAKDYEHVDVKQKETLVKSLFSNPEVNKTFEEEKAAFNKAFPLAQREHISYFIKTSEYKDGLQEAIAETNALLNTKNTEDLFSIRSHYLQQYFPKTIVLLAQLMD